jgi:hypothetical protein
VPRKNPNKNTEEAGMEEGKQRAEAEDSQESQDEEAEAAQAQAEAEAAAQVVEVQVNPALGVYAPAQVDISGRLFYMDRTENLAKGTPVLSSEDYDQVKEAKEPETGLQYIVKKRG